MNKDIEIQTRPVVRANIIIADINPQLTTLMAWRLRHTPEVSVLCRRFEDIPDFDCMVSAGNGFGLMDGGVDYAISEFFGWHLQDRVQAHILDHYLGEQPVGSAFVVDTGMSDHPWLIHSPTMRVQKLVTGTDASFVATWAALVALERHNATSDKPIRSVVFPGMGTGCGQMPAEHAVGQMAAAINHYYHRRTNINWDLANACHAEILSNGVSW